MRRLRAAVVAALMLASGLVGLATAGPASAATICEQYGSTTVGQYIVQNNRWGASTAQCIETTGSGFRITQANHNNATNGPPASYPSIYYGCHYGNCSPGTILPAPANSSQVQGLRSSIQYGYVSNATYNASYDIWYDPSPRRDGQNTGAEIMIWMNRQGSIQPIGSPVGSANIAGANWEVWFGNIGWNVISYVRQPASTSMGGFYPNDFFQDAVRRGHAQNSWYLTSLQAGFEPWVGGTGLAVENFSVQVGGSSSSSSTSSTWSSTTTSRTTTTSTTSTRTTSTTSQQNTGGGGCSASYKVVNQWGGGFQGEVSVRNSGSSPLSSWRVTWTFPNGQTIQQLWGGRLQSSGSSVTVTNESWNGGLGGGQSTSFGFIGSWNGSNGTPSVNCSA